MRLISILLCIFSGELLAAVPVHATRSQFDSLTLGAGPVSVAVRFTAPGTNWTGTLLSRRAPPGEPSLAVTAFRHEPFGKRFIGVALDGVADGPAQTAARTVRDNVIGGHLIAAFCEMDASLDTGTHDLLFRCDGKTAELFIDGVRRESRSAERFTPRTYLKLYPHHPVGWRVGSDPDGRDVFAGRVEDMKVLRGDKTETTAPPVRSAKTIGTALFPDGMNDEQRMKEVDAAMPRWLAETLRRDKWFPRYHPALPAGMMFDTRCAIYGGRCHLFPTWRSDMNLASGAAGSFRMQHLSSNDLVHWKLEPFPLRLADRDVCNGSIALIEGKPQFFFLRYDGGNGAPHRALPADDSLNAWSLPEPQPTITKDGEGYGGRLDSAVFQHGGHYYLTGTRRNANKPSMAMPLYRSDDLAKWEYIGDFFQADTGKNFNECPQIFEVGGKMVVSAFYPLRGREDNYLVGRFENERFIPEAGGHWDCGGHGHARSFDADRAPDGRVIGWSTIGVYADHDALDVARLGWKGMHSLPKEVTLRPDNTLALYPVKEMQQLRGKPTTKALPNNHDGQFDLAATFKGDDAITFATPDGHCTLSYDAKTRVATFDQTTSPKIGADHGHVFRTPALSDSTVRVFFDRSVFEVFAGGYVITSRYFSRAPEKMTASRTASTTTVTAWKLDSICQSP